MCLIDYNKIELGKKRKPITCYKVFETTYGTMDSPLYNDFKGGKEWEVGETRKIGEDTPSFETAYRDVPYHDVPSIGGHSFHTCKTLKGARDYKKWLGRHEEDTWWNHGRKFVIAKCEIPLDTKFIYEGTAVVSYDDEGIPGYVSESIKILKLIH